jgi:peroxin-6
LVSHVQYFYQGKDIDRTFSVRTAQLNLSPPYSTGLPLTPQYYLAELALPSELEVLVSQLDFEQALAELVPSVSKAEMLHYKTIQSRFSGETMNSEENLEKKELTSGSMRQILNDVEEKELITSNGASNGSLTGKGKGKGKAIDQ